MSAPAPTAIVTGAAHGIGLGITRRLLRDGWRVWALDRDAARLDLLREESDMVQVVIADAGSEAEIERAMGDIRGRIERLDGLVCNAGMMVRTPLQELSLAAWNRVLAVNLTGPFLLARAAAGLLRPGPGQSPGAIVTIASTRARMSEPDTESYSASKGGLLALTHALAVSLGPAIRVNCISPGWIDVEGSALRPEDHAQHPVGRAGRVEDVAGLAAWLLGPESGFVTGSEFTVDGGMTRKMIYVD